MHQAMGRGALAQHHNARARAPLGEAPPWWALGYSRAGGTMHSTNEQLGDYARKRNFRHTPEPQGQSGGRQTKPTASLTFVVQKHAASHLHYDFRLELAGVLKSWAIPKGPSLRPKDRRLAVQVEDHPLAYASFEGLIPAGNYGAGEVLCWDVGTYRAEALPPHASRAQQEKALAAELADGHLHIVLNGQKLHGSFSLVRTAMGGSKPQWLLIKKHDAYAGDTAVTADDRSVRSERRLPDPEMPAAAPRWRRDQSSLRDAAGTPHGRRVPHDAQRRSPATAIRPMLATLVKEPFDDTAWIFEPKWDGYRAVATVDDTQLSLQSRQGLPLADTYPSIVRALRTLRLGRDTDVTLDGEIVVMGADGKADFQALQNYQTTRRGTVCYVVFDLLRLGERDLRDQPLTERKKLLRQLLAGAPAALRFGDHVGTVGKKFFAKVQDLGLEGMVAKRADSRYQDGQRSLDWLKIKAQMRQEALVCGFTDPKGSRPGLGSLLLGVQAADGWRFIGRASGRLSHRALVELRQELAALERPDCPLATEPTLPGPRPHWVEPRLVCEVEFTSWTEAGRMRHPIVIGRRDDKPASDVVREVPAVLPATRAKPGAAASSVTHPDKLYWPRDGLTKADMIAYYRDVAACILPYLRDRPENLHRFPNGIDQQSFYQKNLTGELARRVATLVIPGEHSGKEARYGLCQDEATLLQLANFGCIELHPWTSRQQQLQHPDFLLIDLDPVAVPFARVIEVALACRKILEAAAVTSFVKTSGQRGLHILVPLGARYSYEQTRQMAEILAQIVHKRLPRITSLVRDPRQRHGRVYLDYLRNGFGQTIVAPYSLRPVDGAPVSTPLQWSEVSRRLDPGRFTMRTIGKRLAKLGDLWEGLLAAPAADMGVMLEALAPE